MLPKSSQTAASSSGDTSKESSFVEFDAYNEQGERGYIADPTSMKRDRFEFLKAARQSDPNVNYNNAVFTALTGFQSQYREGTWSADTALDRDSVCSISGGQIFERDAGFQLLQKIRIDNATVASSKPPLRLFCGMYTYSHNRDNARAAALTWGHKCDGFLAFSTETIPSLGQLNLTHRGEESYMNMWQKTRSIWAYIHAHYLKDYDFFHLGGDDLFVVVENLRRFLVSVNEKAEPGEPLFLGQWTPKGNPPTPQIAGGPGYTLNKAALEKFVADALPNCEVETHAPNEDKLISLCMEKIGIHPGDTRDQETGEQQYHNLDPDRVYRLKAGSHLYDEQLRAYWEKLLHPNHIAYPNQAVGPKYNMDAAGRYSVSFHYIRHPLFMTRLFAILYRACPGDTPLGKSVQEASHG